MAGGTALCGGTRVNTRVYRGETGPLLKGGNPNVKAWVDVAGEEVRVCSLLITDDMSFLILKTGIGNAIEEGRTCRSADCQTGVLSGNGGSWSRVKFNFGGCDWTGSGPVFFQ